MIVYGLHAWGCSRLAPAVVCCCWLHQTQQTLPTVGRPHGVRRHAISKPRCQAQPQLRLCPNDFGQRYDGSPYQTERALTTACTVTAGTRWPDGQYGLLAAPAAPVC